MKETQLAVIDVDAQRPAQIERYRSNAEAARVPGADDSDDLAGEGVVDDLALAYDQHPVRGSGIDRAIQLGAMIGQRSAWLDVQHELLEPREVHLQRGQILGVNVTEGDDGELHGWLSSYRVVRLSGHLTTRQPDNRYSPRSSRIRTMRCALPVTSSTSTSTPDNRMSRFATSSLRGDRKSVVSGNEVRYVVSIAT